MRVANDYIDSAPMYLMLENLLFLSFSIYAFKKSEKTVPILITMLCVMVFLLNDFIDNALWLYDEDTEYPFLSILLNIFVGVDVFLLIFKNRYDWKKQKSAEYDTSKVQAIYSKPNTLLTLIGATVSLSPKCSVRYSYNGQTIRFKLPTDYPILCDTVIKETDIIENIDYDGDKFLSRFEDIKDKKYNLRTFNCRKLLDIKK